MGKKRYHYVYYSYESWGRGYIGKRSCKCLPKDDIRYFGSFRDRSFKPDQKIILKTLKTEKEAIEAEIYLHDFYKVDINPHFANRARQKSIKFSFSAKREKNPLFKRILWHHKKFGKINAAICELLEMFPEQNLSSGHLSQVFSGLRSEHKGWTLFGSKIKTRGSQRHWYHPEHGIYLNISNRKLCSLFTEQNYYHNMLSRVIKGKLEHHKGWKLYHTVLTEKELLNC
jgi:hypothetical protein